MMRYMVFGLLTASLLGVAPVQAKNPHSEESGRTSLPPGLQKKVARGGELPPGWERKLQVGKPMDDELYQHSTPASDAIKAKLPAGPAGTIEVELEGKIVRMYKATREILDIFELDRLQPHTK